MRFSRPTLDLVARATATRIGRAPPTYGREEDHADYTKEDFRRNGQTYDIIVDTVGTAPYALSKGSLTDRGRLLRVFAGLPDILMAPLVAMTTNKRVIAGTAVGRAEDLRLLAELATEGKFKPVIDRCFPFEQIAEAHTYVDTGRKKGSVIVTLSHGDARG